MFSRRPPVGPHTVTSAPQTADQSLLSVSFYQTTFIPQTNKQNERGASPDGARRAAPRRHPRLVSRTADTGPLLGWSVEVNDSQRKQHLSVFTLTTFTFFTAVQTVFQSSSVAGTRAGVLGRVRTDTLYWRTPSTCVHSSWLLCPNGMLSLL